jgi:octaprenyl-diphosphate synthase
VLNGGGKHLRPTLVALARGALGKVTDAHVTAAVIIEMVHLATLVHDDVMDEAEIRRGQPRSRPIGAMKSPCCSAIACLRRR